MENNEQHLQEERDKHLWKLAKKRVGFRNHFLTYLVLNVFFWGLWYFTDRADGETGIPWPVFPGLGWGLGICFHFLGAYVFHDKSSSIEKEYERLKRKQGN